MKHIIILFVIIILSLSYLNAQNEFSIVNLNNQPVQLEQTWMKTLEKIDNQIFYTSIQKISQNSYNLTLNAIDSLGLTVWEQPIIIDNCSSISTIEQSVIVKSSDNNIIVFWVNNYSILAQKYDVLGNRIWDNHKVVKNSSSQVQKLFSYPDSVGGAYVLWGETYNGLYVSRISQTGNITFSNNGVFVSSDYVRYRMITYQDYAILSIGDYSGITKFFKINQNGVLQQLSYQYDNSYDTPFDIIPLNDGIAFCRRISNNSLYLAKISINGNLMWNRSIYLDQFCSGDYISAFLLYQTYSQNTFYLYVNSIADQTNLSLLHFDNDGSIIDNSSQNTQVPQMISYQYAFSSDSENLKLFAYPEFSYEETVVLDVNCSNNQQTNISYLTLNNKVNFSQFRSIGGITIQVYNSPVNSYVFRLVNDNQIVNHSLLSTSEDFGIAEKLDTFFDSSSSLIYVTWLNQRTLNNDLMINYCDDALSYNDNGIKINTNDQFVIDQTIVEFQNDLYVLWVEKFETTHYKVYCTKIDKNTLEIESTLLINTFQGIEYNNINVVKDDISMKILTNIDNNVFIQEFSDENLQYPISGEILTENCNIISVESNVLTTSSNDLINVYTLSDDNNLSFIFELSVNEFFNSKITCKDFDNLILIMWIDLYDNNKVKFSLFNKDSAELSMISEIENSVNCQEFYLMNYENTITVCIKSDNLIVQKYNIVNNQLTSVWDNFHLIDNTFNDYRIINVLMNSQYYNVFTLESNLFNNYVINNNGEFINSYFVDIVNLNEELEIFGIKRNDYTYAIICNPYSNYTSQVLVYNGISTYSETSNSEILKNTLSNYPNPFNPSTKLSFSLDKASDVKLTVYNIKGQKVNDIFSGYLNSGKHEYVWNGTDQNGNNVSSGIYFTRIESSNGVYVRKMMMIK